MIEFHMDWATFATVISGFIALLTFLYNMLSAGKKKNAESADRNTFSSSLEARLSKIEENIIEHTSELNNINDDLDTFKSDIHELKKEFTNNLVRIENRLEKMLDIILNLKE